jgi:hypothetical protein
LLLLWLYKRRANLTAAPSAAASTCCAQLMGFWVNNTLSIRQRAQFIVYSWPYYPLCSALAEAAVMLQPAQPNGSRAADVQDADEYMQRRRSGMQAELAFLASQGHDLADG